MIKKNAKYQVSLEFRQLTSHVKEKHSEGKESQSLAVQGKKISTSIL